MELSSPRFWAVFLICIFEYYPQELDPRNQIPNTPQEHIAADGYDFIIVGGGSAGCVLANKLTENSVWSVLLIEAGSDEHAIANTPLLHRVAWESEMNWNFTTVPQNNYCLASGGRCSYIQGKVLGGTSSINDMSYVRGNIHDYDEWERHGNIGWGFKKVLKYFRKLEGYRIPFLDASPLHGVKGPLTISYPIFQTPLREDLLTAGREYGWDRNDYNGEVQFGIDFPQLTLDGPSRMSASKAFLNPIVKRRNLSIIKRSTVVKILINDKFKYAEGVEYVRNGKLYTVKANRDVILAAGSVNTPKLLMLSGIGPRKELKKLGIPVLVKLPVGQYFQDFPGTQVIFEINKPFTVTSNVWRTNQSIAAYTQYKIGPLTTTGEEATAFYSTFELNGLPNIELRFSSWYNEINEIQHRNLITLNVQLLTSQCFGNVMLQSSNPFDPPLINPNYLCTDVDRIALERGVNIAMNFMKTPTMQKYAPRISTTFQPLCRGKYKQEFVGCIIKYYPFSMNHGVGTARMGPPNDPRAVVSFDQLIVKELKNLRVVDESVMPTGIRGHTAYAAMMVGYKGAEIIRKHHATTPLSVGTSANLLQFLMGVVKEKVELTSGQQNKTSS